MLISTVAYGLQRALWPYVPASPHLLFYPAVFAAARVGGAAAGYLAVGLSAAGIAYGFLRPEGSLGVAARRDVLDLAIFVAVAVVMSMLVGRLRTAVRREHAAAVRATEAKRSTDATWSMVAHDLRTPLSVITLGSSELVRRAAMSPDSEKTLRLIQRSTDRARDLVDDALDAMKAAEGKLRVDPAPCDARELCAHAIDGVALIASRKGVKLEWDVSTPKALFCDQPRLEQVLTNLLGNAIKFTERNGVVSLYVDEQEGEAHVAVRDTGKGIPPDELREIFTKFWSGAAGSGSGLGLWIACAILDAHGSHLSVQSRVGEGTTFSFKLPLIEVPGAAPSGELPAPAS